MIVFYILGYIIWFGACAGFITYGLLDGSPVAQIIGLTLGIGAGVFGVYSIFRLLLSEIELKADDKLQAILGIATVVLVEWYDWVVLLVSLLAGLGIAFLIQNTVTLPL